MPCLLLFFYGPDYSTRSTVISQCFAVTRISTEHGSAGWQWNTGSQFLEMCYHGNRNKGAITSWGRLCAECATVRHRLTNKPIEELKYEKKNVYVVLLKLCKTSSRDTVYRFPYVLYQPTAIVFVTNLTSIYLSFFPVHGICISVCHEFNFNSSQLFPSSRDMYICMSRI